ncbi:MAG TPA: MopE-related protein [Candidatus Saccharimonadales bacterium]|nr:MopE-related protein [Candidatus Saccharimonadales bacterium]
MRRPIAALAALPLALLFTPSIALASWTASGTFQYVDRAFDQTGFTGAEPVLPVREADIEVVDAALSGRRAVLATGSTDSAGRYSIFVSDSKVRNVYVRVITASDSVATLNIDVRQNDGGKTVNYAVATPTLAGHDPQLNVDFGVSNIQIGMGGEAFNIYDQLVRGADYVASLTGSRPDASNYLAVAWGDGNGVANSYYDASTSTIVLRDTAGYDDTVVLHEMGHHILRAYSATSAVSGPHTFSMCDVDNSLAFEEGWATYFGNSTLRFLGLPGCNIYTRTDGGPGPGHLVRYADLETDTQYLCQGSTSELNVASFLWDIADGPSTPDTTPGMDDPQDLLSLGDAAVWEDMTDGIPGSTNISLEDFWDHWFLPPVQNGHLAEMIALTEPLGIEYHPDAYETNDGPAQAYPAPTDGSALHATLFADPDGDGAGAADSDWFSFNASAGQSYALETANIRSEGDTALWLYDSDGQTLLAYNNDRATGDPSSLIEWTAPRTDLFFVEVHHDASLSEYGSYDLMISAQNPSDDDGDGYDSTVDCDDTDPNIHPGATEVCDGVDQNCDGTIDEGFDLDGDGYTTCAGDCDDTNPAVNPGMDEIPSNGIDDNCNGEIDETPQTDTVTITGVTYRSGPGRLTVYATSDQQPAVTLTLVGFGSMTWDAANLRYAYTSPSKTPNPGTVTVISSGGGSATATVP